MLLTRAAAGLLGGVVLGLGMLMVAWGWNAGGKGRRQGPPAGAAAARKGAAPLTPAGWVAKDASGEPLGVFSGEENEIQRSPYTPSMTVQRRVLTHLVDEKQGVHAFDIAEAVYADLSEVLHALGSLQLRGAVVGRQRVYSATPLGVAIAPRINEAILEARRRPVGLLRESERGDHSDAHSDVAVSPR